MTHEEAKKMNKVIAVIKNNFESYDVVDYGSDNFLEIKLDNTVWAVHKDDDILIQFFEQNDVPEYSQQFYTISYL